MMNIGGTLRPYTDDVAHRAEPHEHGGFVVVCDPEKIFKRGSSFSRTEIAFGLRLNCWPIGPVVRDTTDNKRYTVAPFAGASQRRNRQRLEAIGGGTCLLASGNDGTLMRVEL